MICKEAMPYFFSERRRAVDEGNKKARRRGLGVGLEGAD